MSDTFFVKNLSQLNEGSCPLSEIFKQGEDGNRSPDPQSEFFKRIMWNFIHKLYSCKLVFSVSELRSCFSPMVNAVCAFLRKQFWRIGCVFFFFSSPVFCFLTGQTCFVKIFSSVKQVPHLQMNFFLIT